jgi:hypothetical protein
MITVVCAHFECDERNMDLPPNQPNFKNVNYKLYTNIPDKIDKDSNWEVIYTPIKISGRIQARHVKSMVHEYIPDAEFWLWVDSNMLLLEDPHVMVENYLKNHDVCALPHPERHNFWEESVICSEFWDEEVDNIQKLVNLFYKEGYIPNVLCETGCLLRRNTQKVKNFNKTWWEQIKICRRDQISFPYSIWKHALSLTTFPGTNSHNELRFKHKDYIPQYQGIVRAWTGGYTDRKTI